MTLKGPIVRRANQVLARFDARLIRKSGENPWEDGFRRWIKEAKVAGKDPNDIGDAEWVTDELGEALERWYLPCVNRGAKIVELGPGTGRLTRHLVEAGADVIAVDRSKFVCDWMSSYLPTVDMRRTTGCSLPVATGEADAFFAHGVFEHMLAEEVYWFLVEGARALKPGGKVIFNFDNIASAGGLDALTRTSSPDSRSPFRYHHPEAIVAIAVRVGYRDVSIESSESRIAFALLTL